LFHSAGSIHPGHLKSHPLSQKIRRNPVRAASPPMRRDTVGSVHARTLFWTLFVEKGFQFSPVFTMRTLPIRLLFQPSCPECFQRSFTIAVLRVFKRRLFSSSKTTVIGMPRSIRKSLSE
jgi:hypothetical protein